MNSSQITSGGSALDSSTSARLHKGMPKINSAEKRLITAIGERGDNQKQIENAISPAREPKVPGAGNFVPIGPKVDRFLIKKSMATRLLR